MENETNEASATSEVKAVTSEVMQPLHVYALAALCLVIGLAIGYLLRENTWSSSNPQGAAASSLPQPGNMSGPANMGGGAMNSATPGMPHAAAGVRNPHSMGDMKQMADKQAAPLLEKLKADPKNTNLLIEIGAIYHSTHQFKEASTYYDRAVQVDPKNVAVRNKLAASLFRNGDADGALSQLNSALIISPQDASTLFNIGLIKWQAKHDGPGALAAWQLLLKSNPQLPPDRKNMVEKFISDVQAAQAKPQGGVRSTVQ